MPGNKRRKREKPQIDENLLLQVTFRDTDVLNNFISGQHKILPRRKTGVTAKAQRVLAKEIKRARQMGLLPYRGQHN